MILMKICFSSLVTIELKSLQILEDLSSSPSIHIEWLTTFDNFRSKESSGLCGHYTIYTYLTQLYAHCFFLKTK